MKSEFIDMMVMAVLIATPIAALIIFG